MSQGDCRSHKLPSRIDNGLVDGAGRRRQRQVKVGTDQRSILNPSPKLHLRQVAD